MIEAESLYNVPDSDYASNSNHENVAAVLRTLVPRWYLSHTCRVNVNLANAIYIYVRMVKTETILLKVSV